MTIKKQIKKNHKAENCCLLHKARLLLIFYWQKRVIKLQPLESREHGIKASDSWGCVRLTSHEE